jgi:hypothetical protein
LEGLNVITCHLWALHLYRYAKGRGATQRRSDPVNDSEGI